MSLSKQREEEMNKIAQDITDLFFASGEEKRERVMKRVEGIKAIPIIGYMGDSSTASYQKEAYNKALSDVQKLISEGK